MRRQVLVPRLLLSALMMSGCSPQQDTQNQRVHPPADQPPPPAASPSPSQSPAATTPPDPKLYSLHRHAWIRSRPSTSAPWLGYLGLGSAVTLRKLETVTGSGCNAFQPISPRGFVCLDDRATLDPDAPALTAIRAIAPRLDSPWPHDYAESRQAPRYVTLPTKEQQRRREFRLERHLESVAALRRGDFRGDIPKLLRDVDVSVSHNPEPAFLHDLPRVHEHVRSVKAGSTLSYSHSFDARGRTWIVTGDGVIIPKDRVAPYPRSSFRGVALGESVRLPIGFIKGQPRPQYVMQPDGTVVSRGARWPRLAAFGLTGKTVDQGTHEYVETTTGRWARRRHVTIVRASPKTPWGDVVASPGIASRVRWSPAVRIPPAPPRRTWVEVSVHQGWLIAYEGTSPVRATLVATGRGEPVSPGSDVLQTSTPPGVFAVQGKYWTSTMAVNSTAHFDVPFAMPYFGAYAMHAAYWHDRWGEKVSLGCVNLSPTDARWVFEWSEPAIPQGWYGMRVTSDTGPGTVVVVHA